MADGWYATEALNKALEKTNQLLFKNFNLVFWLKLALIVFLIGGLSFNLNSGLRSPSKSDSNFIASISTYLPIIVVVIAIFLVIGLIFAFIKSVCQFMFIEGIVNRDVDLVKGFKRNLENGFNLFFD